MKSPLRIVCTAIVALATFSFVEIWGQAVAGERFMWISFPVSVVCTVLAARSVWRRRSPAPEGLIGNIVMGALVTGAIGFVAGFVGPMILIPESNQGPLLGIFITGPLGIVVGAIGGAIRCWWR
jgi:hypothetical protein